MPLSVDSDDAKTSSRRELAIDSKGNENNSGGGRKRKQLTKRLSKPVRKRLRRSGGNSDDVHGDSDFAPSDEDSDGGEKKKKKSAEKINWDEIELDVPKAKMTAEKERRIEYRKAAENVHRYLKAVDNLKLPPNPLDELLNELGGKRYRPL